MRALERRRIKNHPYVDRLQRLKLSIGDEPSSYRESIAQLSHEERIKLKECIRQKIKYNIKKRSLEIKYVKFDDSTQRIQDNYHEWIKEINSYRELQKKFPPKDSQSNTEIEDLD